MLPLSKWENQDKSHSRGRELLEFFRPRTGLMQGLRGLCAIGRLLIPLHVQGDTLANVFSRPH